MYYKVTKSTEKRKKHLSMCIIRCRIFRLLSKHFKRHSTLHHNAFNLQVDAYLSCHLLTTINIMNKKILLYQFRKQIEMSTATT